MVQNGECLHTFQCVSQEYVYPPMECTFSSDGQYILCSSTSSFFYMWDVRTRKLVHMLQDHAESPVACAFSPDGRYILSGGAYGSSENPSSHSLRLWDMQTEKLLHIFQHTNVHACAF